MDAKNNRRRHATKIIYLVKQERKITRKMRMENTDKRAKNRRNLKQDVCGIRMSSERTEDTSKFSYKYLLF